MLTIIVILVVDFGCVHWDKFWIVLVSFKCLKKPNSSSPPAAATRSCWISLDNTSRRLIIYGRRFVWDRQNAASHIVVTEIFASLYMWHKRSQLPMNTKYAYSDRAVSLGFAAVFDLKMKENTCCPNIGKYWKEITVCSYKNNIGNWTLRSRVGSQFWSQFPWCIAFAQSSNCKHVSVNNTLDLR